MDKEVLFDILNNMKVDNIRHVKMEWYDEEYLKVFEYHQIKTNKEDK
ncbi:MAG: hypothetical protein IJ220_08090 [Clostridia bacterium]|nr:hypothetical protein [Clostridia bacterium]